jgi:hypothetical protein
MNFTGVFPVRSGPSLRKVGSELAAVEEITWNNYSNSHKTPTTIRPAADPEYELSVEWKTTRDRLLAAGRCRRSAARVLLINERRPQQRRLRAGSRKLHDGGARSA